MRKIIMNERDVDERTDRGGGYRVLITPGSVDAQQLIMGTARVPPGDKVAPHAHDYSEECFFVMRGQGLLSLDGLGTFPFRAGDACFVPQGVVHTIENTGEEDIDVVFASAPLAPRPALGHRNIATETGVKA